MRLISFLFFIGLFSISCNKTCPEDIKLGDIPLMESSLSSIPYQKGQIIQFRNSTNDTLAYELFDLGIYDIPIYLGTLCESKETNSILHANSTQLSAKFRLMDSGEIPDLGTVISFDLDVRLHNLNRGNPLDTLLVDKLDIYTTIKVDSTQV